MSSCVSFLSCKGATVREVGQLLIASLSTPADTVAAVAVDQHLGSNSKQLFDPPQDKSRGDGGGGGVTPWRFMTCEMKMNISPQLTLRGFVRGDGSLVLGRCSACTSSTCSS